jgi:intracellular septation protein A
VASPPRDGALPASIEISAVLRTAGPRLVRDGFGPLAVFFAGWKLVGLGAGIALAVVFGLAVFAHARRSGHPAMIVRVALVLVAIRATVGLSSGSASVYLAQEIGIDALLGCALLGSLLASRPLAGVLAGEFYPFTAEMRRSEVFASAMVTITAVWAGYFFARGLVRLTALLTLGTDSYVLVVALTDAPFLLALLAWSVYYTAAVFRGSALWGPMIAAAEAPRD